MPRKGPAPRRELLPDPIYHSVLVTQLVNKILSRGKRSLAERIVYDALDAIKDRTAGSAVRSVIDQLLASPGASPVSRMKCRTGASLSFANIFASSTKSAFASAMAMVLFNSSGG